ncbi:hypothetical protein [Nonomuraea sp. NPDC050540]|uniref:hypothetical protein n=1 Tax=Nonomuraea sp. NPDC050540 TaxID=3364367 RepID=UPI00378A9E2D
MAAAVAVATVAVATVEAAAVEAAAVEAAAVEVAATVEVVTAVEVAATVEVVAAAGVELPRRAAAAVRPTTARCLRMGTFLPSDYGTIPARIIRPWGSPSKRKAATR